MCSSNSKLQQSSDDVTPVNTTISDINGRPVLQPATSNRVPPNSPLFARRSLKKTLSLPKSISMLPSPTPLHTTNIKTNQPPISPKLKSPRQPAVKRGGNSHSNDMTSSSDKLLLPLPTKSTTPKSAIPIKKSKKCTTTGDHPGNFYLIHLEREATEDEHREIARFVTDNQVFQLVGNVMIVGKPNRVTYRGPTMLATTLHAMAILLRIDAKWDWFINLSASDYPLVTQDDLISAFSVLPRHLNFIQHSSRLGWKLNKRGKPIMIDPGLYSSNKSDIWWVIKQRALPTAFKLYTGSAWTILSRSFTEYCIIGYENLPRTLLLYYTNFVSSPEGYFQTVICNSKQYKNTTVNHDLHYITWDTPPKQHPRSLGPRDYRKMVLSSRPFARKFKHNNQVLDRIDKELLKRRHPSYFSYGGWCLKGDDDKGQKCRSLNSEGFGVLRPGAGGRRLKTLLTKLTANPNFSRHQCR